MKEDIVKVGDEVLWAGAWASEPYKKAKIVAMEINCGGDKYGQEVQSATWKEVIEDGIVTLDNGHWSYGYQLKPLV